MSNQNPQDEILLFDNDGQLCDYVVSNMRSPCTTTDDGDFGLPRSYPTGYNPPKSRFSKISTEYRQKEEKRKAWNISFDKLCTIYHKNECLSRWVLIRNFKKKLEEETMDEIIHRNITNYDDSYSNAEYAFEFESDFDASLTGLNLDVEEPVSENERFISGKKYIDDLEDCDVEDLLSQLYMPPSMIVPIDDDEGEPSPKRIKTDSHKFSNEILDNF